MPTRLDALKELSTVVADTGDLDAIRTYQPVDSTTNPSLLLKAFDLPGYQDLIDQTLANAGEYSRRDGESEAEHAVDCLSVAVGSGIAQAIPGRVSTEVAARLSFDEAASIAKARKLVDLYAQRGINRDRILIKLAATWAGIRAAETLEAEGINCNLTLLFSEAQARACFEAGVFLISPFVGRVTDWYKQARGVDGFDPDDDPGVAFVRNVVDDRNRYGYNTVVMGASFRNSDQIVALAGCDRLTISPALLDELASDDGGLTAQFAAAGSPEPKPTPLDEAGFRWQHNQDPMAIDKLAEGIRKFDADQAELERRIEQRSTPAVAG
ncbi:transaldolase [Salinisphaera orenii]|uniref:transaldolase n=1 Tax=Salinisphaera orenii TaxID=856731 RepID=UPI000DBE7724